MLVVGKLGEDTQISPAADRVSQGALAAGGDRPIAIQFEGRRPRRSAAAGGIELAVWSMLG